MTLALKEVVATGNDTFPAGLAMCGADAAVTVASVDAADSFDEPLASTSADEISVPASTRNIMTCPEGGSHTMQQIVYEIGADRETRRFSSLYAAEGRQLYDRRLDLFTALVRCVALIRRNACGA